MRLIIITGAPASGKSSIAEQVGKDLDIQVISKDGFKIQLFESYGFTSHAEKKQLSIRGEAMMYNAIVESITNGTDLIVDNNFKNYKEIRRILNDAKKEVVIKCVYCVADYSILAQRYNDRIANGNRHLALYTLNQYPLVSGISEFHPVITKDDVYRIEQEIQESTFGEDILQINTDKIEENFEILCNQVKEFIK